MSILFQLICCQFAYDCYCFFHLCFPHGKISFKKIPKPQISAWWRHTLVNLLRIFLTDEPVTNQLTFDSPDSMTHNSNKICNIEKLEMNYHKAKSKCFHNHTLRKLQSYVNDLNSYFPEKWRYQLRMLRNNVDSCWFIIMSHVAFGQCKEFV